jgi:hypothetical protein
MGGCRGLSAGRRRDCAAAPGSRRKDILNAGLVPVSKIVDFRAYLIANSNSLKSKAMADVLASLTGRLTYMA